MSRPTRATPAGRAYPDLQNRARRERRGTQELLTMYVVERWLARLSGSPYADDFVLKGGMLLAALGSRRPTVDADTLARHLAADQQTVAARVAGIATLPDADDGVEFLTDTLTTQRIHDAARYGGVRVTLTARLDTAVVKLRLDLNFGDPVTPAPQPIQLPALRPGAAAIPLLGYPIETVLAEKLATAIELGAANTRVRDFVGLRRPLHPDRCPPNRPRPHPPGSACDRRLPRHHPHPTPRGDRPTRHPSATLPTPRTGPALATPATTYPTTSAI